MHILTVSMFQDSDLRLDRTCDCGADPNKLTLEETVLFHFTTSGTQELCEVGFMRVKLTVPHRLMKAGKLNHCPLT
jgi:hypothetical protein